MKKILLIILDGVGDRPSASLNNRTPLQAAYRPNMNYLAKRGLTGVVHSISAGVAAGSDTSHLSLLGYNPKEVYTGRGPFEAIGLGMKASGGDIAFRANFATIDDEGIIVDRRAGRNSYGTEKLAKELSITIDDVKFFVKEGVEHRAALLMRGEDLSPDVSDSDPHVTGEHPRKIAPLSDNGRKTAEVLNKYLKEAFRILRESNVNSEREAKGISPANALLLRGAGVVPKLQPFEERYGMKGACVAGIPLINGIASLCGLDVHTYEKGTGTLHSDFFGKTKLAVSLLKKYDFVLMNIKAPDIAGHDRDPVAKKEAIERIDKAFSQLEPITKTTLIAITGDHSTPCSVGEHSGDSVPIVFMTEGIRKDATYAFDEISCSNGLLRITSNDVMQYLLALSDRTEKYGA